MSSLYRLRKPLLNWYRLAARKLPWRETHDPYRIWVSEIMLQQTRVAAVIPYYERFLERFPTSAAPEAELLAMWSGLGYYSRARNLQKAAQSFDAFPAEYSDILALPGVGPYTAAAVASIAFGLPHAVLDGNVMRVISRLTCDKGDIQAAKTKDRMQQVAQELLDPTEPGLFNQAMMELGATICLPREPKCGECPVARFCQARLTGIEKELPVKLRKMKMQRLERTVLVIQNKGRILLWQRTDRNEKLAGFWELPEPHQLPQARIGERIGGFRHAITNHNYVFEVFHATARAPRKEFVYIDICDSKGIPLSTTVKKALAALDRAVNGN
jgi:A/G-specific adenine glycosylase